MIRRHNNKRRSDDSEIRSKMELLAELQIRQIELEIQNRELKVAQQQLETTRDRLSDLYDFSPVGYLTLDKTGRILEINLTGSAMLGENRASIVGEPLTAYIVQSDSHIFFHYLQQIFNSPTNTIIELRANNAQKFPNTIKHVRLESIIVPGTKTCRTIMTDINQLKETTNRNHELLQENRRLMQNLFKIQEEERRLLARELHDELGQWLTAIYAEAEAILNQSRGKGLIHTSAQSISECARKMHEVIHSMLHQLRPALLDSLGLVDALLDLEKHWHAHHSHIALEFKLEGDLNRLGEQINITVFRIIQEALNNIYKHAQASQAKVLLSRRSNKISIDNNLSLHVEDNGKGYPPDQISKGLGLLGIRERAIAAGGKFTVRSTPNHGTHLYVRLPLNRLNNRRRTDDF